LLLLKIVFDKLKIRRIVKYKPLDLLLKAVTGFFLFLFIILFFLSLIIRLPAVQTKLKNETESLLQEKLNCDVTIEKFRLGFPKKLVVSEIIVSKKNDTLLSLGEFSIDIKLLPLLSKKIVARNIELKNTKGDVGRLLSQMADTSSGGNEQADDVEQSSWVFIAEKFTVESSYFKYRDAEQTYEFILDIGNASLSLGSFNFDTLISVKAINLKNTAVSFESLKNDDDTSSTEFADIRVEKARLENSGFTYIDTPDAFLFYAGGEKVNADDLLVDINNEAVVISKGISVNTNCIVKYLSENESSTGDSEDLDWGQALWRVVGDDFSLDGFRFMLDYLWIPETKGHFDNNHIDINHLTGRLTDFVLDKDTLTTGIHNLSAKEKNALNILKMNGQVVQEDSVFNIKDLKIVTPDSKYNIKLKTTVSPTNYNVLRNKEISLAMELNCGNWKEVDYFYPFIDSLDVLSDNFRNYAYNLNTSLHGTLDSLIIDDFDFNILDSVKINTSGFVCGLAGNDNLRLNFHFSQLLASKTDMEQMFFKPFPDSNFLMPEYLKISGDMGIENDKYEFAGDVSSNVGVVKINNLKLNEDLSMFDAGISANLYNLQSITDAGINSSAFQLSASFEGDSLYVANGNISLHIDSCTYNEYNYKNIDIKGELSGGKYGVRFVSSDPGFDATVESNGTLSEKEQNIFIDMNIGNMDLHKLNLFEDTLALKSQSTFAVNIREDSLFNVSAKVQSLDLSYSDTVYKMHPVTLSFGTCDTNTFLHLESYFYHLNFIAGDYFPDFVTSVSGLPEYYLADTTISTAGFSLPEFSLKGNLKYPEVFARLFFPGLPSFESLSVDGSYNSGKDEIDVRLLIPGLKYNSLYSDSLALFVSGDSNELNYKGIAAFRTDDLLTGEIGLSGQFKNSELISTLMYNDKFDNQYLNLTVRIDTSANNMVISLIQDSLIFSYDNWHVNPENVVIIGTNSISFNKFDLSSGGQEISINSIPGKDEDNFGLRLNDFKLGSLEGLFALDTIVSGTANADFKFYNVFSDFSVNGDLTISNMDLYDFDAGKLKLTDFVLDDTVLKGKLAITGEKEDVSVNAHMGLADVNNPLLIDMNIKSFDIDDFNYILADYINDAKGTLTGSIKIAGNVENPVFNGIVSFKNAGVGINSINNYFILGNEKITVKNNVIDFNELSITNKKGQKAKVIGKVSFGAGNPVYSNLMIKTDNMEIINSSADDNELIFGMLKAQADVELKGTPDKMNIDADVDVDSETDLTYIFPDGLYINDNSGIVRFGKFQYDSLIARESPGENLFYSIESLNDAKVRVNIKNGARFKLFFDKGGSDYLDASINGSMNYIVYEGTTGISGMFTVEDGTLHYSIPLVTVEDFTLEPGSYFTMSNDIYNPHLNIIASAKVRASTKSLMPDYDKVMTFKVLLYMIGDLNDVKLRFDISTNTNDAIVSARLSQLTDEERNINGLNLLVRGSFIISVHGDEAGSSTMLDSQIDKFYTSQLNHLISDNVRFVDLNFDVQSFRDYNSSGDLVFKRNYYYNIGKSLIHNRVRINYKGSLGFTSDLKAEQVNSSFVQNELEAEIKITKDGTFRGVLFRKDKYEGLLEGEILETGGGLKIKKSFYSFKDMFTRDLEKKAEKEKAKKKKEQEIEKRKREKKDAN